MVRISGIRAGGRIVKQGATWQGRAALMRTGRPDRFAVRRSRRPRGHVAKRAGAALVVAPTQDDRRDVAGQQRESDADRNVGSRVAPSANCTVEQLIRGAAQLLLAAKTHQYSTRSRRMARRYTPAAEVRAAIHRYARPAHTPWATHRQKRAITEGRMAHGEGRPLSVCGIGKRQKPAQPTAPFLGPLEQLQHVTAAMPNELLALARHDHDHRLRVVEWLAADLANPFPGVLMPLLSARAAGFCSRRPRCPDTPCQSSSRSGHSGLGAAVAGAGMR